MSTVTTQTAALLALLLASSVPAWADASVEATAIRLSADAQVTGVWIDGQPAPLKAHAGDWSQADDYGPRAGLHSLAVSAQAGTGLGRAGFIGAVVLKDGRWVITDDTWRAWPGPDAPRNDAAGRAWTAPDYDDHAWRFATDIGPYGTGPWGSATEPGSADVGTFSSAHLSNADKLEKQAGVSRLDDAMRLTPAPKHGSEPQFHIPDGVSLPPGTDISAYIDFGPATARLWNADWIWAGPPLGGAPVGYFRKDFTGGATVPPNAPQNAHVSAVTPTGFTLAWQPCFSAQGPVTYEMAWNGQVMLTTAQTSATLNGLTINPVPQNYAWVRAVAPDGTRSRPSSFVLIATPATDVPGVPAHVRIISRGPHGVGVAWDPAPDDGELDHYDVTLASMLCVAPPGVCVVTVDDASFIKPGSRVTVKVWAQGESGKNGPSATVESWTLPDKPTPLSPPEGLRVTAGSVRWNPVPGATTYQLWRDGTAVPGTVTGTETPLPAGARYGFLQLTALDGKGNISPKSEPVLLGQPAPPAACTLRDGGRSGRALVLRWNRPAAGTCLGYRVEMETGATWSPVASIDDPWQDECIVGQKEIFHTGNNDSLPAANVQPSPQLEPGTTYRFRVVALAPDKKEVPGEPLALTTVAPPVPHPLLRFAVILATDGRYDYLDKSLADAEAARCAFALLKGQLVQQLSKDPGQWDKLQATLHGHHIPCILALLGSKDGWSEINDFATTATWAKDSPILGRYDMGLWRTGQPFDQLHTELGGALRMAGVLENPLGNANFLPDLEQWEQQAEADPACRWFFTGGVSTEDAPNGVPGIILETFRPGVDFMRMINGDRGHELALDTGSNVACASPQRNRVGAHYLVTVEDTRLVLESRQLDKKSGAFSTDGLQEIVYDRAANHIAASNLRIPYPFGIATGLPRRADHGPAWTQNRIVTCLSGGQANVQLLGHSASDTPLKFLVTRPPLHGSLSGTGGQLVYHPAPGFHGEDVFLYRADDGAPSPANTAWVRITVGPQAR